MDVSRGFCPWGDNVDDIQQVFSDQARGFAKTILTIPYDEARPLLDDLLSCCTLVQGKRCAASKVSPRAPSSRAR